MADKSASPSSDSSNDTNDQSNDTNDRSNDTIYFASDLTPNRDNHFQSNTLDIQDFHESFMNKNAFDVSISNIQPDRNKLPSHEINAKVKSRNIRPSSAPIKGYSVSYSDNKSEKSSPKASFTRSTEFKYLKSKDDLINEAEDIFKRDFNFQPYIYTKQKDISSNSKSSPVFNRDRIDEMLSNYHKSLKQREKQHREEQSSELLECTFTPIITRKADLLSKKRRNSFTSMDIYSQTTGGVSNRLHEDALKRIEQQKWLTKHVEDARYSQYTFKPSINSPKSRSQSPLLSNSTEPKSIPRVEQLFARHQDETTLQDDIYKPIHERIYEMQKQKVKRMNLLKASIEEETLANMTFTPKIDIKSKKIAQKKIMESMKEQYMMNSNTNDDNNDLRHVSRDDHDVDIRKFDVVSRLQLEGIKQRRNKQKLIQNYENNEFYRIDQIKQKHKLKMNQQKAQFESLNQTFDERQENYLMRLKTKKDKLMQQQYDIENDWFQPKCKSSEKNIELLMEKHPDRFFESINERIERLTKQDIENKDKSLQILSQEVYKDVTFVPNLNEKTNEIGRKSNLTELVENNRVKKSRQLLNERIEMLRSQEYSFKPKITDYFDKAQQQSQYPGLTE